MQSAKPIEAGCRAILLNGEPYIGTILTVKEKYIPKTELEIFLESKFGAMWNTDFLFERINPVMSITYAPERYLMRIDDPDLQKQIEQEKELSHV